MKSKKIPGREGTKFTALLGSSTDFLKLWQAIAGAIEDSSLREVGLQSHFELRATPEPFFQLTLYSTENATQEQIQQLLRSVHDVLAPDEFQIRELSAKKITWSEEYHEEYYIDIPDDQLEVGLAADVEFSKRAPDKAKKQDCWLDLDSGEHEFVGFRGPPEDHFDEFPAPSKEQVLHTKRIRNRKAVWEHRQTPGYRRGRKAIDPKK